MPVAWVKSYGEGRVYYNNLGHNRETWSNNAYLDSIAAGVKWIRISGDAASSPNPEVSAAQEVVARQAVDE